MAMQGKEGKQAYIPSLKYNWLTALYDPLLRWTLRERTFKERLVQQAGITAGQHVLDLGCGTATLTLLIKQTHRDAEVVGLDGDRKVLDIARAKLARAHMNVSLIQEMSYALPFPDNTFDRVVSSLLFHHLTRENKQRTLREVLRVLKPGGELHVADWGQARNGLMRLAFFTVQLLDGFETTRDHVNGRFLELWAGTGFQYVRQTVSYRTLFGTVSLFQACKF
jgi:SAM-dependent methyltransferase